MAFTRAARALAAGLSLVALTACTVDGTATRGPVDLDTGKYSTKLASPAGEAATDDDLNSLRAVRLGESIVFHDEVDPALNRGSMPTYPVTKKSGLAGIISDVDNESFMRNFQYGFSVAAGSKDDGSDKGFNHAVFVFDDAASASAAADGLARVMETKSEDNPRTPTTIPGAPDAMRAVSGKTIDGRVTVGFTPVGDKLIYTWADSKDQAWTENTVRVAYEKQKALLDDMKPISDDRQMDPDGLLRATLPSDTSSRLSGAVLGPRATALMGNEPASAYAEQQKAGVTASVIGDDMIVKTGSDAQATAFMKVFGDRSDDSKARKATSPQDLSSVPCYTVKSSFGTESADCYVTVGRYVAQVSGSDLKDAQQKASAQYVLLGQL